MSWDAYLNDDRGHEEGDWNYTHNTNGMIAAAYEAATGDPTGRCPGPLVEVVGPPWWERLDGATGQDGRRYLDLIIVGLKQDPERYRAMNPSKGWGDYDSLVAVLSEMRDRVPAWPTKWQVHG